MEALRSFVVYVEALDNKKKATDEYWRPETHRTGRINLTGNKINIISRFLEFNRVVSPVKVEHVES